MTGATAARSIKVPALRGGIKPPPERLIITIIITHIRVGFPIYIIPKVQVIEVRFCLWQECWPEQGALTFLLRGIK